ncbi:hypothetical protein M5K25_019400 [Dendrobium thyrsiflorum]|uniref:EF-hand domain-containing protein n=1 Tax=Dendrobium thyrsiflorum TaxID=117978 RepID=A0ABD0UEN3_DENTH
MANQEYMPGFVDFLPKMAKRIGTNGLLEELCEGFYHLVDAERGLITLESLKKNARRLGLGELGEEQAVEMLRACLDLVNPVNPDLANPEAGKS